VHEHGELTPRKSINGMMGSPFVNVGKVNATRKRAGVLIKILGHGVCNRRGVVFRDRANDLGPVKVDGGMGNGNARRQA
jgi:hypothetical protein